MRTLLSELDFWFSSTYIQQISRDWSSNQYIFQNCARKQQLIHTKTPNKLKPPSPSRGLANLSYSRPSFGSCFRLKWINLLVLININLRISSYKIWSNVGRCFSAALSGLQSASRNGCSPRPPLLTPQPLLQYSTTTSSKNSPSPAPSVLPSHGLTTA